MEEEISLRDIIEILFQGKKLIACITLACILISAGYSFYFLDPVYEATTILSVNQDTQQKNNTGGLEGLVNELTELPRANAESYATQAKTSAVIRRTMERVGIDPATMPVSAFSNKVNITNLDGTDLLQITAKDKDPKLAASISNALAEVFVDFVSDTSKTKIDKTITFLESQVDEEQLKVDENVEKMKKFLMQSPSVTQLERELETNLNILNSLRSNLVEYNIMVKGLIASIEAGEKQLAALSDKIQLKRTLLDDPALGLLSTGNLELLSEEINPVYVTLAEQLSLDKSMLTQYQNQKATAESLLNTTVDRIEKIQVELADKKTLYNQLETELESSIQNSELFKKKYSETKIAQSVKAGEATIVVVSPAHEPILPVGPRKIYNVALASLLGLMLGGFVVVFRVYMVNSEPKQIKQNV